MSSKPARGRPRKSSAKSPPLASKADQSIMAWTVRTKLMEDNSDCSSISRMNVDMDPQWARLNEEGRTTGPSSDRVLRNSVARQKRFEPYSRDSSSDPYASSQYPAPSGIPSSIRTKRVGLGGQKTKYGSIDTLSKELADKTMATHQMNGLPTFWYALIHLLIDPTAKQTVVWTGQGREFVITDEEQLIAMWSKSQERLRMVTSCSLRRQFRECYRRGILLPVTARLLHYTWSTEPSAHVGMTRSELDDYIRCHCDINAVSRAEHDYNQARTASLSERANGATAKSTVPSDPPATVPAHLSAAALLQQEGKKKTRIPPLSPIDRAPSLYSPPSTSPASSTATEPMEAPTGYYTAYNTPIDATVPSYNYGAEVHPLWNPAAYPVPPYFVGGYDTFYGGQPYYYGYDPSTAGSNSNSLLPMRASPPLRAMTKEEQRMEWAGRSDEDSDDAALLTAMEKAQGREAPQQTADRSMPSRVRRNKNRKPPIKLKGTRHEDYGKFDPNAVLVVMNMNAYNQGKKLFWFFLLELLVDPSKKSIVAWTGRAKEFVMPSPSGVTNEWSEYRNTGRPTQVQSMRRLLRDCYKRRILIPVDPKLHRYAFVTEPSVHVRMTAAQLDEYIRHHAVESHPECASSSSASTLDHSYSSSSDNRSDCVSADTVTSSESITSDTVSSAWPYYAPPPAPANYTVATHTDVYPMFQPALFQDFFQYPPAPNPFNSVPAESNQEPISMPPPSFPQLSLSDLDSVFNPCHTFPTQPQYDSYWLPPHSQNQYQPSLYDTTCFESL